MKNYQTEQTARQIAKRKVEFKIHISIYSAVMALLSVINLITSPGYLWVIWPLFGWGIGVLAHGISVRSAKSNLKERMISKEMKKTSLLIVFLASLTGLNAQETTPEVPTESKTETNLSGYGGFFISGNLIDDDLGIFMGGKGGIVLNNQFGFGGIGYGIINPIEFEGDNLSGKSDALLDKSYGAGGVYFEYILNSDDFIHFSFPVNLMAGGISVYEVDTETEIESSSFFILEPGACIDFKITDSFTSSLYVSYKYAFGSSLTNIEDEDISGLNIGLVFKFGKY
jgi:hypothetical protein